MATINRHSIVTWVDLKTPDAEPWQDLERILSFAVHATISAQPKDVIRFVGEWLSTHSADHAQEVSFGSTQTPLDAVVIGQLEHSLAAGLNAAKAAQASDVLRFLGEHLLRQALLAEAPDNLRVLGEADRKTRNGVPRDDNKCPWIMDIPHSAKAFYNAMRPRKPGGEPPFKLLRSSYVLMLARKMREAKKLEDPKLRAEAVAKLAITYRQAMPPEAFMTPEEVEEQSKEINPGCHRLAAAALSYCWELPSHPDPQGNSLLALADAVEECYQRKKEDQPSKEMRRRQGGPYRDFPDDMGIFWDYPCLFQHPPGGQRTPEQDELFKWALAHLELIYAHQGTTVFRLIESAPPARASYNRSGWPRYESNSSRILKVLHVGVWPGVIDVGKQGMIEPLKDENGRERNYLPPPASIREFREQVPTLHFTNGADAPVVADIYERMIRVALGGAVDLVFNYAGWGDAEAASFAESLVLCTRLETLRLNGNMIGAAGMATLAKALGEEGAAPNLQTLGLKGTLIGSAGLAALTKALGEEGAAPKLQTLTLSDIDFSGADEAVRALGQAHLTSLKQLDLDSTKLSLAALFEGMPAGAWPSLERLSIQRNEQPSDEWAGALARALERGAMRAVTSIFAPARPGSTESICSRHCSEAGKAAIDKVRPGVLGLKWN